MTALVSWRSSPAMPSTLAQGDDRAHPGRASRRYVARQKGASPCLCHSGQKTRVAGNRRQIAAAFQCNNIRILLSHQNLRGPRRERPGLRLAAEGCEPLASYAFHEERLECIIERFGR